MYGSVQADGYLRFADEYVPDVQRRERELTARYGFESRFGTGDVVELVDESGDVFAYARVLSVVETDVAGVVDVSQRADGYPTYFTTEAYSGVLAEHYPGVGFGAETPLTLIRFEVIMLVE